MIPRSTLALIKALLVKYHDNASHAPQLSSIDGFIRANPERKEGTALQSLGVLDCPWEIVGMDYVTDLRKTDIGCFTSILIIVCHLPKMDHFAQFHKDMNAEESADLFINHCYRLHGLP